MREEMKNMTALEIVGDFLHIAWYIGWRIIGIIATVSLVCWLAGGEVIA